LTVKIFGLKALHIVLEASNHSPHCIFT